MLIEIAPVFCRFVDLLEYIFDLATGRRRVEVMGKRLDTTIFSVARGVDKV